MYAPRCMPALPAMVMRPRVMPRPIHLTLPRIAADLQLVAGLSLDREEIVQAALPLAQVDRKGADRVVGERRHHVRREDLRLERDVGLFFEGQGDHAGPAPRHLQAVMSGCPRRSISTG